MKIISSILFVLFTANNIIAQKHKWSIEVNIGSQVNKVGVFNETDYKNQINLLSGAKVYFYKSSILSYYLAVESKNNSVDLPGGYYTSEYAYTRGTGIRSGGRWQIGSDSKFRFLLGFEFFGEITKVRGIYSQDHGPPYGTEINHKRMYLGVAPSLTIDYKAKERIYFYWESRAKFGSVDLERLETESLSSLMLTLIPNTTYWKNELELLSSFGIRFDL